MRQRGALGRNAVRVLALQSISQHDTIQCGTRQHHTQCCNTWHSQWNTMQHSAVQHRTWLILLHMA